MDEEIIKSLNNCNSSCISGIIAIAKVLLENGTITVEQHKSILQAMLSHIDSGE